MLQYLHMVYCIPLSVIIFLGTKISTKHCLATLIEMEDMYLIHYSIAIGSFIYEMFYTR
jgi:hypothetical protein